jgi:hypothetical protein
MAPLTCHASHAIMVTMWRSAFRVVSAGPLKQNGGASCRDEILGEGQGTAFINARCLTPLGLETWLISRYKRDGTVSQWWMTPQGVGRASPYPSNRVAGQALS